MGRKTRKISAAPDEKTSADERLELLFRHAGLSEKQAKLYRLLLITGKEKPSTLAQKSGIKRSNTYALLDDLARRGLVRKIEREKIIYFSPEPPHKLAALVESRKKQAQMAEDLTKQMLPNLVSQFKAAIERPVVQSFEGVDGLYDLFYDIYSPDNPDIYGCVDLSKVHSVFPEHVTRELIPRRVKHKTKAYALLADSEEARTVQSHDAEQLRISQLFDPEKYPLPAEIEVYKDKIAFMSFERNEFVALLIDNPAFATTLRSIIKWVIDHRAPAASDGASPTNQP